MFIWRDGRCEPRPVSDYGICRPRLSRYVRDLVDGANDGLVTTFAVVTAAIAGDAPPALIELWRCPSVSGPQTR